MINKTGGTDPTGKPQGPNPADGKKSDPRAPFSDGGTTFLGMYFDKDEAKQLWNVLLQNINNQISKDKERAMAALKKLKESIEDD